MFRLWPVGFGIVLFAVALGVVAVYAELSDTQTASGVISACPLGGCPTPTNTPTPTPSHISPSPTPTDTPVPPTDTPTPTPTPFPGVMEVDCDASAAGVQSDCTHSTGGTFSMQVHVTAPPEGGYFGFQVKLRWTDEILDYLPAANQNDEALWPECDFGVRLDNQPSGDPSVVFGCVPSTQLNEGDTFTGPVLQFQFQCQQDGNTPLVLVRQPGDVVLGSHFVAQGFGPIDPILANATVTCAAPTPTPVPPTPIGGIGIFPGVPGGGADAGGAAVLAWLAAGAVAGALALGGAAWYARRRRAG